jgi:hypothetical protein
MLSGILLSAGFHRPPGRTKNCSLKGGSLSFNRQKLKNSLKHDFADKQPAIDTMTA